MHWTNPGSRFLDDQHRATEARGTARDGEHVMPCIPKGADDLSFEVLVRQDLPSLHAVRIRGMISSVPKTCRAYASAARTSSRFNAG